MKRIPRIALVATAAFVLLAPSAFAKVFSNQFVEFQLPDKWECMLDGTEWVCQSTDEQKKRDAIIVLAAKIRKSGMDEMGVYKTHLEKKQTYQSLSGDSVESEPRYVKEIDISGHQWVDSLHLQSEIPDFYTRYLATIKEDLGVLVTFSVRKDKYEEYGPDIDNMVKSLRAFRKPGDPNASDLPATDASAGDAGVFGDGSKKPKVAAGQKPADDSASLILLLLLLGGAGGFIIWRKKKKGGGGQ